MLTDCKDELPNPYKNCVREILGALICHDNDNQRLIVEIRDLENEFKQEIRKIEFRCSELRKPICEHSDIEKDFEEHIADIDEVTECFTSRIEALKKNRQEILDNARQCLIELNKEKCKFKHFHEKTIENLKRLVVNTYDPNVIRKCEIDICEMHKVFVKEVSFIKSSENVLLPFLQQLQDTDFEYFCNCCCFKNYEWVPEGKTLAAVEEVSNCIKNTMGSTLKKAFAQLHIHQSPDSKSFLAGFLINLIHNEELLEKKLHLIGGL